MANDPIGVNPNEISEPGSLYGALRNSVTPNPLDTEAFGWRYGDYPDRDPFGSTSTAIAEEKIAPLSSNTVTSLDIPTGKGSFETVSREELVKTETGRKLVSMAEDIRRGHKRNFFDGLFGGPLTDFVPFFGGFASVAGSLKDAKDVRDFYENAMQGNPVSRESAMKAMAYELDQSLAQNGTWGYKFGSIVRQAPSFFAEFAGVGKVGEAVRTATVRRITSSATDAAARKASYTALSSAAKVGIDEYADRVARMYVEDAVRNAGKSAAEALAELSGNGIARAKTLETLTGLGKQLVTGVANAVAEPDRWAPGLADKVVSVRCAKALDLAISRQSATTAAGKAWNGIRKSVARAAMEGLFDMGAWGNEAASVINTGLGSAGAAAVDALTQLTVGAAARGSMMFLPKEGVNLALEKSLGFVGANELSLKSAAYHNDDEELMERAGRIGMFMDLMEYISESTGRGFSSAGRAIGMAVAPKLMAPVRKTAGLVHPLSAKVTRDSAGAVTDVVYNGLFETGKQAEVGGVIRRYLEARFGGTALRENVASDQYRAAVRALEKAGVRNVNPAALQATITSGSLSRGLSPEAASVIGSNVRNFVSKSVRAANAENLEGLKIRGMMMYHVANFMAEHNYDALAVADKFRQMGYDGVAEEMFEERYSDVVNALFGNNAHRDQSMRAKFQRAWRAAFAVDEDTGKWRLDDLLAEAAAFSVPLVARASIMRGIAAAGGPNKVQSAKDWASKYLDGTRYDDLWTGRRGDYLVKTGEQIARLRSKAAEFRKLHDDEMSARESGAAGPRQTDAQLSQWLEDEKRYVKAASRAESIRDSYLASFSPVAGRAASDEDVITYQPYSDAYLLSPDEEYNLRLHPGEAELRKSAGAYEELLDGAAEAFQTSYKLKNRIGPDEGAGWFRKAAHRVVSGALRLLGTAATGDVSFMSVNPVRWSMLDRGLPGDIATAGESLYAEAFARKLAEIQDGKLTEVAADGKGSVSAASMSDYDAAHAAALEEIRPKARELMGRLLAAHQTRSLSTHETRDVAMAEVARTMGYVPANDGTRTFVQIADPSVKVAFDDFMARDGVAEKVSETSASISRDLYGLVTSGLGVDRRFSTAGNASARSVDDVLVIPRGFPTERQAVLARVLRSIPAYRDVLLVKDVTSGDRSADDYLDGVSMSGDLLDAITAKLAPVLADGVDAGAIMTGLSEVDDSVIAQLARELNLPDGSTPGGLRARNDAIAQIVAADAITRDRSVKVFSRAATADEIDSRLGNPFGVFSPARRTADGRWATSLVDQNGAPVTAADEADLARKMASVGYSEVSPKIVFTSYRTLTSSDPLSMIRTLNLSAEYRRRMTGSDFTDPLLRTAKDGGFEFATEDDAAARRAYELKLAGLFEAVGRQRGDNADSLYLRFVGNKTGAEARDAARKLRMEAEDAWDACYSRNADGKAVGYVAIADDLLREYGVEVPFSSRGNAFGTATQALRGRYSVDIRALRSVGATGNVFIPINHGDAQDYKSALLDNALLVSYSRNIAYLRDAFPGLVSQFLSDLDRETEVLQKKAEAEGDTRMAEDFAAFRTFASRQHDSVTRMMSPTAFTTLVSAFNLYRTEVSPVHQLSVLGRHAAALKAIAPVARGLTSYIGWTAAVDRVLGGTGFEPDIGNENRKSGLEMLWTVFKPADSSTLREAMEKTHPGKCKDFAEFADKAMSSLSAASRPAFRPDVSDPLAELRVAREVAGAGVAPEAVVRHISESVGDVSPVTASERGGDTAAEAPAPETADGIPVSDDADDFIPESPDVQWSMEAVPAVAPAPLDFSRSVSLATLSPSETKCFARTVRSMCVLLTGADPNRVTFRDLVRRLAPQIRQEDLDGVMRAFADLSRSGVAPDAWAFPEDVQEDEGEESGSVGGSDKRAVDILKSKALSDFLAMMNVVSPTTGRDFQPFVEDLRSIVRSVSLFPSLVPESSADAFSFLSRIINPRMTDSAEGQAGRNSLWRHELSAFDTDRARVVGYIREFLNDRGRIGEPVVFGRAALLLSYLASLPVNTRVNLASLIGSSAPADPVRLGMTVTSDRNVFSLSAVRTDTGRVQSDAVVSSFARFADMGKAEFGEVVSKLRASFDAALRDGKLRLGGSRGLLTKYAKGIPGVFDEYVSILAPVFGVDSPIVSMLMSGHLAKRIAGDAAVRRRLESGFCDANGSLPVAARSLLDMLDEVLRGGDLSLARLSAAAVEMYQSGPAGWRNVTRASTSLQGTGIWKLLAREYSSAKPVSVMRAETDPERTSKESSSLAITMVGIEPALQEFMDRKDEYGFEAVVREWMPGRLAGDGTDARRIAACRQQMVWPTASADSIVVKSLSKSALATEVLDGCRASYAFETMSGDGLVAAGYGGAASGYAKTNSVYVPLYSGDHSSSIIIRVPLARQFAEKGMSYDDAASLVSKWLGLDMLGVDAKRAAVTSMEAVGTSMWDYRYDADGNVVTDEAGNPVRGHAWMSIAWDSDPDADNEALLGTTGIYGYGARRQMEVSKDPKSATVKCHVSAVGADPVFGPTLSLVKSLSVTMPDPKSGYSFVAGSVMSSLHDHSSRLISGEEDISTVTYVDFDSYKLGPASSKVVFAGYDEKGKPVPIMKYVFDRLRLALDGKMAGQDGKPVEIGTTVGGAELDEIVGDIDVVNLGDSGPRGKKRLSELLGGAQVREVSRPEGEAPRGRMFTLDFHADSQMAFQVANVSHVSRTDVNRMPRNTMLDALTMTRTLSEMADKAVFRGADSVTGSMSDLLTSFGAVGASVASYGPGVDRLLATDEEYQVLLAKGGNPQGSLARDRRRRIFSAYARKNFVNVPVSGIQTPLVANGSWIGKDGRAHSHSTSRMFNDTIQGARTIGKADREFMRGVKHAAIANVNCTDASFRHGLYVSEDALFATFRSVVDTVPEIKSLSGDKYRQVVALLEHVITAIAREERGRRTLYAPDADGISWREKLAGCLLDHHGQPMSLRTRTFSRTVRDEGQPRRETVTRHLWEDVSYDDLFTSATSAPGETDFDRTAVYPSMFLDADKRSHVYLGGTLMGLPRTPSYNGSMFLQNARAGLPVTEYVDADTGAWECGRDAMVSPDPFTLKILGCDHDGDKTLLYMLTPRVGSADVGMLTKLADGLADGTVSPEAVVQSLADAGYVEYEKRNGTVLGLRFSRRGAAMIGNAFVQGLFDMNRMLPVATDAAGDPVFSGPVRDGSRPGLMFGATKATVGPKTDDGAVGENAFDTVMGAKGVLSAPVLDLKSGKLLGDAGVAARVQASAAEVSEARAVIVSIAGALHMAWQSRMPVGPVALQGADAHRWVDFIYHVDGLSNMTFDDLKEQLCSRAGVKPGMIETIAADMILAGKDGALPTTDREFNVAFRDYSRRVNDENDSRFWMSRASDPADFQFRRLMASKTAETAKTFETMLGAWAAGPHPGIERDVAKNVATRLLKEFGRTSELLKQPFNGYVYWLANVCPEKDRADAILGMYDWYGVTSDLAGMRSFKNSVDYTGIDPAADYEVRQEDSNEKTFGRVADRAEDELPVRRMRRMRTAVRLFNDGAGSGETVTARAVRAARDFRAIRQGLVKDMVRASADAGATKEAALAMSAYAVPTVGRDDTRKLQSNSQMFGWSLAAFRTVRSLPGSSMTAANMYDVMRAMGEAAAAARHPKAPGTNVTLDVRYAVETMLDVMARFVKNSTAHARANLFDYLTELPDATSHWYSPEKYGPAASGLSRIGVSLSGMTEGQRDVVRALWSSVVDGRVLDSVSYGAYESTTGYRPKYPLSLALSSDNLKSMLKFVRAQSKTSVSTVGESTEAAGGGRDVERSLEFLVTVFKTLDARFGKGFTVQPSAMFGQLLPVYAALTNRVAAAPGEGTPSLFDIMPDYVFKTMSDEYARIEADAEDLVSAGISVNWSPVLAYKDGTSDYDYTPGEPETRTLRNLRSMRSAEFGLGKPTEQMLDYARSEKYKEFAAEAMRALVYGPVLGKSGAPAKGADGRWLGTYDSFRSDEAVSPDFRPTLSVFDGARGVFYRQVLDRLASGSRAAVTKPVPAAEAPASGDNAVANLADRMRAVLSRWDGGTVEYSGGQSFVIRGVLHDASGKAYETKLNVEVVQGDTLVDPEDIGKHVGNQGFLETLSYKTGRKVSELLAMSREDLVALAKTMMPVGASGRTNLSAEGLTIDSRISGLLSGKIRLASGSLDTGTAYHELFHSVMGFMRNIGALSIGDVNELRKAYGDSATEGSKWFNEEKAAEDFRKLVTGKLEKKDAPKGILSRIADFIRDLCDLLFDACGLLDRSSYGNPMETNPLATVVLTGRIAAEKPVVSDLHAKLGAATDTYLRHVGKNPSGSPLADGTTVSDMTYEELSGLATSQEITFTREWAMLHNLYGDDPRTYSAANLAGIAGFLSGLEAIAADLSAKYGDANSAEARREKADRISALVSATENGVEYRRAYSDFMKKFGPTPKDGTPADSISPSQTVPNEAVESDISDYIRDAQTVTDADGFDPAEYGITDEDAAWSFRTIHGDVKSGLREIGVDRMARPYTRMNVLAREVSRIVRGSASDGETEAVKAAVPRECLSTLSSAEANVISNALRQLGSFYGVDVDSDAKLRDLAFKTTYEVYSMLEPLGGRTGGTDRESARHVSAPVVAAAVVTSAGARPCDIAESALADLGRIEGKYRPDSSFVLNVISPLKAVFKRLETADPSGLVSDFGMREKYIWQAVSEIRSGLVGGNRLTGGSGEYARFRLASGEPSSDMAGRNLARYADHIGNDDFHAAVHTALDRLFMLGASMRFYRQLGFEPGRVEDVLAIRRKIAPDGLPEPMTPAEAMTSFNAAPEQLADSSVDVVDFSDQPYFVANHPEAWFDSMTRPRFGNVDFREASQEARRAFAGFVTRHSNLNNLQTRLLGLDVQPGQALTAIDRSYRGRFAMEAGHTRRKDGETALKFLAYDARPALDGDGKPVIMTLTDSRRSDMYLKALNALASGDDMLVTGVDGLTFSANDSTDPEHYTRDAVEGRAGRTGIAGGYSDFDRVLLRMCRQLSDDRNEPWNDLVGGEGLGLYNRMVRTACGLLSEAKRRMTIRDDRGRPLLDRKGVNDFVLSGLESAGLVVTRESYDPALKRRALTVGAVAVDARRYVAFFKGSDTWRKLLGAGRTEEDLSEGSLIAPMRSLWREVAEFVDSNPFLSDGDGSFFHNVSTPFPFVQGSGYFMYAANRRYHEDVATRAGEALNAYEDAFLAMCKAGDATASSAPDSGILLFRTLFHTQETGAEAVRAAIADGKYEQYGLTENSTQADLAMAIGRRLVGMMWDSADDPVVKKVGGGGAIGRMLGFLRKYAGNRDTAVTGAAGLTPTLMYRMHGVLPANNQLGHAVGNAIQGIANAYAFRATLFNMMTTPDSDGTPVCYAKPSEDAADAGGLTDQMWGAVARWWAEVNGIGGEYDPAKSGVRNAAHIYDVIHGRMKSGKIDGVRYGEIPGSDIDVPSIEGVFAKSGVPEDESALDAMAGGYALGYARHLFQSTRALGHSWQRKLIHRAYSYSKSLSVSFSYFFPLATRFESPIGALGALATLGGNMSPEAVRKNAQSLSKIQKLLTGKSWITKDFLGERDVFDMLDSNDPYLSELYHWAGCLGIGLSDSSVNPYDPARGIMQDDIRKVVRAVRLAKGSRVAARVDSMLKSVLTKSGDRAFTYHLNATKLAVVAQLCVRLQAEAAANKTAFDPVRDLKRYSGYINAEVGGIDPLKYAWAHPAARSWLEQLFFSWEWTRGAWEAGGGPILEQALFGGHSMTREERHFMLGRWTRMFLEIMIGVPMIGQAVSKALGEALVAGLDPDDPEVTEEERNRRRRLIEMVRRGTWTTWNNESKIGFTGYDVTPLMAGIAARFPRFAEYADRHPLLYAAPTAAAAVTGKPWAMFATVPVYTGRDAANTTGGRRYYQRYGKQGWEFFRWFDSPVKQFMSKLPMPVQRIAEGVFGRSLTYMDHPQPYNDMGDIERWISPTADSAWFNLARAFVPFSVTSLADTGDAGFLSVLGPVSMGASKGDLAKRMSTEIDRWASNDRRGYAFGGPSVTKQGKFKKWAGKNLVSVASLLNEARLNGLSEKDAYGVVDTAVRNLTGGVYDRIVSLLPDEPDGKFDELEMGRVLRKANRLGMLRKTMRRTLKERLMKQNRWNEMRSEEKERMRRILNMRFSDPYGVTNENVDRIDY